MRRRLEAYTTPNTLLVLQEPRRIVERDEVNNTASEGVRESALHHGVVVRGSEFRMCDWSKEIRVAYLIRRGVNGLCR